ncbi:MAG: sugar transferase [Oscillatoriales cyanobacterium RM2_1_1]|nr:sugar transferase [Oscillatoriales cyanobacterium SM2_3_0]NJO45186.1 sugar transferase [Oscillatoriales cyanobacterium RM2_1_1]
MTEGIYTLANDVVYDQLVALLNSIEANAGRPLPVCVIPYNNRLDRVREEIAQRPNVTLFEDIDSIARWENFATQAWSAHPKAQAIWQEKGISGVYRIERYRKYCCFDGPFDQFIFFDADTLLMRPLDQVYQKLGDYDWITNDFQYRSDLKYIFDCSEAELLKIFPPETIPAKIFCSGWFASHRQIFDAQTRAKLLDHLQSGEAEVMAWWDSDQTLLNYMVWRSGISYYNFAYDNQADATGCHWSSSFEERHHILYDKGQPISYIHYMSVSSSKFEQLCRGEDVGVPYQDLFLHYRYLNTPDQRPPITKPSSMVQWQRQVKQVWAQKSENWKHRLRQLRS